MQRYVADVEEGVGRNRKMEDAGLEEGQWTETSGIMQQIYAYVDLYVYVQMIQVYFSSHIELNQWFRTVHPFVICRQFFVLQVALSF